MKAMRVPRAESAIEATFAIQVRELRQRCPQIPAPARNLVFLRPRKFELDFAWPALWFGVEIDGHAHRTRERFDTDREKGALALLAGWKLMHVTGLHVRSGSAIGWAEEMLRRLTGEQHG